MDPILDISTDGTVIRYAEEDDRIVLKYEHPDADVIERVNADEYASKGRFEKKGAFHHVFRIPQAVLTKICSDTGLNFFDADDAKRILQILKGPEYRKFRTYQGRI